MKEVFVIRRVIFNDTNIVYIEYHSVNHDIVVYNSYGEAIAQVEKLMLDNKFRNAFHIEKFFLPL